MLMHALLRREIALGGLTALLASSYGDGEVATEAVQVGQRGRRHPVAWS